MGVNVIPWIANRNQQDRFQTRLLQELWLFGLLKVFIVLMINLYIIVIVVFVVITVTIWIPD
jgi:hypothetical protein